MSASLIVVLLAGETLMLLLGTVGLLLWACRRQRRRLRELQAQLAEGEQTRRRCAALLAEWARQAEELSGDLGHDLEPVSPARIAAEEGEPQRLVRLRQALLEAEQRALAAAPPAPARVWQSRIEQVRWLIGCFDAAEQATLAAAAAKRPGVPDPEEDAVRLEKMLRALGQE